MICKFCGGTKFLGHQLCRMDVLVGEDGEFLDDLPGGAESHIYDSEEPYGPFTCQGCGAVYENIWDSEEPTSGPVEGWCKYQFKKVSDYELDGVRRQRWTGLRYAVCLFFYPNGKASIVIERLPKCGDFPKLLVKDGTIQITSTPTESIPVPEAARLADAIRSAMEDAYEIQEQFVDPIRDGTFDMSGLPGNKSDMSGKCGIGYEQMFAQMNSHKTSREEFEAWYEANCAKCMWMNETCMYGEPIEDNDKVVAACSILRTRACESESWDNIVYLAMTRTEFNNIPPAAWHDDGFIKKLLLDRVAKYLTTAEGWASICNSCKDYNWGDLMNDMPLPECGLYFDKYDVAQYPIVATTSLLRVNQDELIAPDFVRGVQNVFKDGELAESVPVCVNFQDGHVDLAEGAVSRFKDGIPQDEGYTAFVTLENGTTLKCETDEDFAYLKDKEN